MTMPRVMDKRRVKQLVELIGTDAGVVPYYDDGRIEKPKESTPCRKRPQPRRLPRLEQ